MPSMRGLLFGAGLGLLCLMAGLPTTAEGQQTAPPPPTFRVTSNLVFLDVTVLDKKGRPVATGLTKDDFTILENEKPQRIFRSTHQRKMRARARRVSFHMTRP